MFDWFSYVAEWQNVIMMFLGFVNAIVFVQMWFLRIRLDDVLGREQLLADSLKRLEEWEWVLHERVRYMERGGYHWQPWNCRVAVARDVDTRMV